MRFISCFYGKTFLTQLVAQNYGKPKTLIKDEFRGVWESWVVYARDANATLLATSVYVVHPRYRKASSLISTKVSNNPSSVIVVASNPYVCRFVVACVVNHLLPRTFAVIFLAQKRFIVEYPVTLTVNELTYLFEAA